jgi:hypothetical protein
MRVYELSLFASVGLLTVVRFLALGELYASICTALIGMFLALGGSSDGFRIPQLLLALTMGGEAINWFLDIAFVLPYLNLIILAAYVALVWAFGMMNFKGMEPTGPYKVGYSERFTTKNGNFCAVYYPAEADAKMGQTVQGCIDGPGKEEAIRKVMAWI